jgi:hypothetical protein
MATNIGYEKGNSTFGKAKQRGGKAIMEFEFFQKYTAASLSEVVQVSIKKGESKQGSVFREIQEHLGKAGMPVPHSLSNFTLTVNDLGSDLYERAEMLLAIIKASGQPWIIEFLARAAGYEFEIKKK